MDKKQNLNKDYTAIFLLAGSGRRIAELTKDPKCLLKINNETIIERNLEIIRKLNIKHVILVLGFKKRLIIEKIKRYKNILDIKIVYNNEYIKKGNSYSLFQGLRNAKSKSLIFDGDLVFSKKILENFLRSDQKSSFLIGKTSIEDIECAKTLVDEFGFIRKTIDKRAVKKKELKQLKYVGEAIGIIKIENKIREKMVKDLKNFLKFKKNIKLNWEHFMNNFFELNDLEFTKTSGSRWVEIDTKGDYHKAIFLFKKK